MVAYAAASSSTASFETFATPRAPIRTVLRPRRRPTACPDALTRVWVLDDVPASIPVNNPLLELGQAPKDQLADPALAAQLLGASFPRWWPGAASSCRGARGNRLRPPTALCSRRCSRGWSRSRCAPRPRTTRRVSPTSGRREVGRRLTSSSSVRMEALWPSRSSGPAACAPGTVSTCIGYRRNSASACSTRGPWPLATAEVPFCSRGTRARRVVSHSRCPTPAV